MKFLFEIILFLSPIQSFVVTNIVKGLTFFNAGIILYTFLNIFYLKKFSRFLFPFFIFFLCYIVFFLLQQYCLLISPPSSIIFTKAIFISPETSSDILFRSSFITQSLYLVLVIFFFYHLLNIFIRDGANRIINLAFSSIMFFVLYGFFEFFYFFITGDKSDFISNRIAGDDFNIGLFQYFQVGGVKIMRMKSLAGEPSMFAFTILPFFIFSIYLKYKRFSILFLSALLLSTSTTAILGLIIYLCMEIFFGYNRFKKLFFSFLVLCFVMLFSYEFIFILYESLIDKISLISFSGIDRFSNFINHIHVWSESSLVQKIFGYGFGYFRSTDGFSTLLVNIGVLGLVIYCLLFLLPYFLIKEKTEYIKGLYISNFVMLILIFISIPEFYMPHVWFFNALIWAEYFRLNLKNT